MPHPPTARYAFDSDTPGDPLPTARGLTQVFVFMHIHYPISACALPNLIYTYATSNLIYAVAPLHLIYAFAYLISSMYPHYLIYAARRSNLCLYTT